MYTFKGGNSFLELNDHIIQFPIAFDFIHSEDFDTTKEIMLFKQNKKYSILFYSILFYSILFYSILFYSILFYSILFYSIPTYSEGFTTFILLEFSQNGNYKYWGNHTYSNEIFNQIKDISPKKRVYYVKDDKTKTPKIYVRDLLFSNVYFDKPDLNINDEYEEISLIKSRKNLIIN